MRELLLAAFLCAFTVSPLVIHAEEEEPIKTETPVVTKFVGERDARGTVHYQKHADADAGMAIPYRLHGSLPSNWDEFDNYYYSFDDILEDSLVLDPASVKVEQITSGGAVKKVLTEEAEITHEETGNSLHVTFPDLKQTIDANPTTDFIRVSYEASLHPERMTHGRADSNDNVVSLEYTVKGIQPASFHRKIQPATRTEKSVEDLVKVYTWKLRVQKEDMDTRKALQNVEFTLKDSEGQYVLSNGTRSDQVQAYKTSADGLLEFPGLDADVYILEEKKAADGYQLLEKPVEIEIKSNLKEDYTLEESVKLESVQDNEKEAKITLTDEQKGVLELSILNRKTQDPSRPSKVPTGLIQSGSMWLGLLLASGSGVWLVSRKRK
ncbi:SpaA isopeptide-forming pilin-related protein [Faecalibaculum rodentium]|uniref:SpaA isopeptide-forming pilin-related protein n=1 Tax=Faecalibaculum rodentium TaxID=1702221 RepID=UPI0023EF7CF3|nr:SpaA isopeptide-forming pilin-related protein [Faecalibaculum rodentium]